MIKQIKDLSEATIDDLNDSCQFVMDDSNDKTKKVSFNVLKQKIGSGGYESGSTMPAVVGSIIPYMGTDLPEGYLMCDGSEVDKTTYSELYAVIGDRFGTASDTSKFKLPKLNDNIYLQGSNDPCLCVDEELPNITGKIDASGQSDTSEAFGEIYADRTITEGAFKDGLIIGNQRATLDGDNVKMMRGFKFDASKSSSIYKDNGHVIPNSVTVRYLICYKKVIGKVDAMIGMPDYSREIDLSEHLEDNTTYEYTAPEDGFVSIGGMACSGTAWLKIDGKLVANGTQGNNTTDVLVDGMYPVSKGSLVEFHVHHGSTYDRTKAYMKFYPAKPSPAKISELFMGAPDWDKLTEDAKIFDKILDTNTEEQFESSGDGFLVVRCDATAQGLYYTHGLYVSKNGIMIFGGQVFGSGARKACASVIPCSKGDKFVIGNAQQFLDGEKHPIHAYVYFIPNKKIQIDVSDVVATGSGGVIDGEMWKPATVNTVTLTPAIQEVYTVENDSAVYIAAFCPADDKAVYFYLDQAGNKPIIAFDETGGTSASFNGATVFIKKGCKIYAKLSNSSLSCTLTFIEYKLHSLAPQIAMPDYKATPVDVKAAIDASTDKKWIATENGWLHCSYDDYNIEDTNKFFVYIKNQYNEICIYRALREADGDNDAQMTIIPISTGDAVIYEGDSLNRGSINFYPCKAVPQKSDKEEILNLIYPVGSIYFDRSNGEVCPLTSVITGSEWQKIGTKLLTDGSTAPVVGTGSALGFMETSTPDAGTFLAQTGRSNYQYIGGSNGSRWFNPDALVGLTTDPQKSGLVTNLGDATGITVAIWERKK